MRASWNHSHPTLLLKGEGLSTQEQTVMPYQASYANPEPTREHVDSMDGLVALEFGAPWCGFCQGAQPLLQAALGPRNDIRHVKVEDGRGRPLGRSFGIKLWPTLVLLRDGREVARVVRPAEGRELHEALAAADA